MHVAGSMAGASTNKVIKTATIIALTRLDGPHGLLGSRQSPHTSHASFFPSTSTVSPPVCRHAEMEGGGGGGEKLVLELEEATVHENCRILFLQ